MTPEQIAKRKRIMERSIALGHCICDPAKPCPCPLFKSHQVCECAGERLPRPTGTVRLTEHVRNPGCASKVNKETLTEVLAGLPEIDDPRVLIGSTAGDDAGVIELDAGTGTVLTVDVFSPSVDDAHTFGRIAAANSLSDIYAMGATPHAALSIVGYPTYALPLAAMHELLAGGLEVMHAAGVPVVGGHSINDDEPKAGFAVLGTAPTGDLISNAGARPGDAIVLTKPIGGGIVNFARQIDRAPAESVAAVTAAMTTLNRAAGERLQAFGAHACTDVTGFSLLIHLAEMARRSAVAVELDFDTVPLFPGVRELAREQVLPGALERNREAADESMLDLSALSDIQQAVLCSPETNGGLLVSLGADRADAFIAALATQDVTAVRIATITDAAPAGRLTVTTAKAAAWQAEPLRPAAPLTNSTTPHTDAGATACCCAGAAGVEAPATGATTASAQAADPCCSQPPTSVGRPTRVDGVTPLPQAAGADAFGALMQATKGAGALDNKSAALMGYALSIATKCATCVHLHAKAARAAGASEAELAQAAGIAIAFGGASVNMFYNEQRKGG
ncbi:MAG: selenide, water dikinase SelD [Planctomycetota bacterium]